jgi:splicing factor 3B subunit 5
MSHNLREARDLATLQARHVGTGSSDTTVYEFNANMQRDTLNSFVGHPSLLQYAAIGLGQTREQMRVQLLERMVRPAGPPPAEGAAGVGSMEMKEKLERIRLAEENLRLKHEVAKEMRRQEALKHLKK